MKLSVVTIHKDDFEGLKRTYKSIDRLLKNADVEWIVIDGASAWQHRHEEFKTLVEKKATVFVSEKDSGIYNAMNKGIQYSNGEYVLFMNAGDELVDPEVLTIIRLGPADVYLFDALEGRSRDSAKKKQSRSLKYLWWGMPTHHQALIIRTKLVAKYGFDESLKVASDYKNLCQIYRSGASFSVVSIVACFFDTNGLSSNNFHLGLSEQQIIRKDVLGLSPIRNRAIAYAKLFVNALRNLSPKLYDCVRYE